MEIWKISYIKRPMEIIPVVQLYKQTNKQIVRQHIPTSLPSLPFFIDRQIFLLTKGLLLLTLLHSFSCLTFNQTILFPCQLKYISRVENITIVFIKFITHIKDISNNFNINQDSTPLFYILLSVQGTLLFYSSTLSVY